MAHNSNRQLISTLVTLLVLILLGVATGELARRTTPTETPSTTIQQVAPVTYQGQNGKTVLELLEQTHTVEKVDSPFGTFVQSIDGVSVASNAAWFYYIDGQQGTEAADQAQTTDNQTIEWRYEQFAESEG